MISIIPKPNKINVIGGFYKLKNYNLVNEFSENDKFITELFNEFKISRNSEIKPNIVFLEDKRLQNEEYHLIICDSGIEVHSATKVGAFYALQSLKQIFFENKYTMVLPCVEIEDKPRFSYRSFMLDEARHFFGKDIVKEILDIMAMLKLNHFHWHLTDDQGWRVEIKKYPLLTKKGSIRRSSQTSVIGVYFDKLFNDGKEYGENCYYTQEDLKEIVEYASERNIEICPEIDMPGHLTAAIACYPKLSCFDEDVEVSTHWGIRKTIGCAGKKELYDFVYDVIDELSQIFTSKYFHIGGDEAPKDKWKKCPNCQKMIKEQGLKDEQQLQGYFNNEVANHLEKLGKRTVAWNEILKSKTVSDKTIVQYWIGNPYKNGVNEWLKKGNNIIISRCSRLYMDYMYSVESIKTSYETDLSNVDIPKVYEKQILGFEAPLWSEYVASKEKLEYQIFPRVMSLAEINWTESKNKNFDEFFSRMDNMYKYLDQNDIEFATKKASNPVGVKKFNRLLTLGGELLFNPQREYNKYNKHTKW